MDTDKNWVNWRPFDANSEFEFILCVQTDLSHVFTKTGLYLFCNCQYNARISINTTAARTDFWLNLQNGTNRFCSLIAFNAIPDQTLNVTGIVGVSGTALFYIGSGITNVAMESYQHGGGDNGRVSLSLENETNKILIGCVAGSYKTTTCTSTTMHYATDNNHYGCVSTFNETGSGSFTGSGSSGGDSFVAKVAVS